MTDAIESLVWDILNDGEVSHCADMLRAALDAARAEGAREAVREPVRLFALDMESKLRLRDSERGKRGWEHDVMIRLLDRMFDEWKELAAQLNRPLSAGDDRLGGILEECADVGNFAMMIADIARTALRSRAAAGGGNAAKESERCACSTCGE